MKFIHTLKLIPLLVVLVGCATNTAYIESVTDNAYEIRKDKRILLWLNDEADIKTRNFYSLLESELVKAEFNLVKVSEAGSAYDYVLTFGLNDRKSTMRDGSSYYIKDILLNLYSREDIQNKIEKSVWEGRISGDSDLVSSKARECVAILLDYFGVPYEKHTPIR